MIFEAISIFAYFGLVITMSVPLAAMIITFRAKLTGRYLNRYFIVSRKNDGSYELHHHPSFGFYYARERKLFRFTVDAIQKFRKGYPDLTLTATSLTLQSRSRKGTILHMNGFRLTGARLLADFLILTNLANYRRSSGHWCFINLIRFVHRNNVIRYVLLGRNGHNYGSIG
ncbi:hypothetical protein [Paenibacillus ihuae]|uniref:hypothetical protein n=1 Tax=Paenibacillus ihuae TaxID=1232431 RepID=UPI0006D543D6|nr:hypothetical protein [Paenibacillus ihuae]